MTADEPTREPHSGQPGAEAIWEYRSDLEQLARVLCRHHQDAEDVAQSALMKAAEKIEGFRGEASVRTWLHTIATNECRMLRRRKQPTSLDQMLDSAAADPKAGPFELEDPSDLLLEVEARVEVLDAIANLSTRERCAVLLRDGRGMSVEETAELMESTVPAVKSLLYRARHAIRNDLDTSRRST